MNEIKKILLEREDQRHANRQKRIDALLTDDNSCFEAEIKLVEEMRKRQILRAEESHKLMLNQINHDADSLREEVIKRHLAELEAGVNSAESTPNTENEKAAEVAAMMEGSVNGTK